MNMSPFLTNDWPTNDVNQTRTFGIERDEKARNWWARQDSNLQPDRNERVSRAEKACKT